MTSKYVPINKAEMDAALALWNTDHPQYPFSSPHLSTSEYVYDIRLNDNPHNVIRVYSSVRIAEGTAHPVGKDAIRVVAFFRLEWHKYARVHRTQGWYRRLFERLREAVSDYEMSIAGPIGRPTAQTTAPDVPVVGHHFNAHTEHCAYCGNPDVNGEVEGIGPLCAAHMDTIEGQPVMAYFAVKDNEKSARNWLDWD